MDLSGRLGRVVLLGAILALGWIGQSLLLAEPPRLLDGLVILALAATAFAGLVAWSREDEEPQKAGGWIARLHTLVARVPQSFALLTGGVVCGALAYWFDADPALLPWGALLAWAGGIILFLVGAWQLDRASLHPEGDIVRRLATGQASEKEISAVPQVDQPVSSLGVAHEIATVEMRADPRTEYVVAGAPMAGVAPYARWEIVALLTLTLLALLARVVLVDRIPQNFGGDEGEMGLMARLVLQGQLTDPFITGWLSHPTLWFFMQALSLQIFGDGVFGLRVLSALIGTATIPALYVFARPLYGRAVALAAAALLVTYHFHIHFSRVGVNNIVDPLIALLAFAAFFYGYRTRSFFGFGLAGVLIGIGQHFYMGGRLTPLLLLVLLAHQALLNRTQLWRARWGLALLALGFVLGIGPLARFFLTHRSDFTARLAMVGIFESGWFEEQRAQGLSTVTILLNQVRDAFGAYIFQPDRSAWYDPKIPLLDRASAVLFIFGLTIALSQWRRMEMTLLVAWIVGAAIFGGVLLKNSPESPRFVTTAPALCLLIAMALERLVSLLSWALPLGRRVAYGVGAAVVLLLALWNLNFYFREYTPRRTFGWLNTEVATAIGNYLHQQPDAYVYFFGPPRMFVGNGTIRFMALDTPGVDLIDPLVAPEALPPPPDGRRPIFIFLPERAGEIEVVERRYPGGTRYQADAEVERVTLFYSYEPKLGR
jgi:4-amino-4-deoxy-L-arabinose transferase-like glycosyltransferase